MRKPILLLLALLVLGISSYYAYQNRDKIQAKLPFTGNPGHCKDCNVILVSLDTLSANHLPCYGYDRNTSPVLCEFGNNNIFFEKMYSNSTWTLPSHVSIFTGLYSYLHGVIAQGDRRSDTDPFLLNILKDNGYKTTFVSNLYDYTIPVNDVFNEGIDKFVDEGEPHSWTTGLEDFKTNVESGKKSFLFLHTYSVHDPYMIGDVPKMYTNASISGLPTKFSDLDESSPAFVAYLRKSITKIIQNKGAPPDSLEKYKEVNDILNKNEKTPEKLQDLLAPYGGQVWYPWYEFNYRNKIDISNPEHIAYIKALYDQTINEMDQGLIKYLLDFTSDPSISKKTIIVITADHGEEFMEHGHISHETAYDSNLRIPLIMKIPGLTKPYKINKEVQSVDILPTLLDSIGINIPSKVNGVSLLPLLSGKDLKDRFLIADGENLENRVLRKDGWTLFIKVINGNLAPYEFYDTNTDPGQKNNVLVSNVSKADDLLKNYLSNYKLHNGD